MKDKSIIEQVFANRCLRFISTNLPLTILYQGESHLASFVEEWRTIPNREYRTVEGRFGPRPTTLKESTRDYDIHRNCFVTTDHKIIPPEEVLFIQDVNISNDFIVNPAIDILLRYFLFDEINESLIYQKRTAHNKCVFSFNPILEDDSFTFNVSYYVSAAPINVSSDVIKGTDAYKSILNITEILLNLRLEMMQALRYTFGCDSERDLVSDFDSQFKYLLEYTP